VDRKPWEAEKKGDAVKFQNIRGGGKGRKRGKESALKIREGGKKKRGGEIPSSLVKN